MRLKLRVASMRTDVFFDTNVLLALVDEGRKAEIAEELLIDGGYANAFVLAEAAYVLIKKWKLPWSEAHQILATFRANTVVLPVSDDANVHGARYAERYKLQTYDAGVIAAAVLAGCTTLWSEDMHHGLKIDGLTVRNPFRG
jgi:predicted nucleic acid-binding protein